MRFDVIPMRSKPPAIANRAFLESNNWNDYGYTTLFTLWYRSPHGELHRLGNLKIAQFGLSKDVGEPDIPESFEELDRRFFSLGQDDSYYDALNSLGEGIRRIILRALNDVALDLELFERALQESVTGKSLLRDVSRATVRNQFHRMSEGGVRLSPYSFSYKYPATRSINSPEAGRLSFAVTPASQPPTNVHVVIGRNGVGKSWLLNQIANILVGSSMQGPSGDIIFNQANADVFASKRSHEGQFANLVSVAFSAFDEFEPLSSPQDKSKGLPYAYIGLKKITRPGAEDSSSPKDSRAFAVEFGTSVNFCLQATRLPRWRRALEMLESDPVFADVQVTDLADSASESESLKARARDMFRGLSSGHKIVLLTITRLVETVEERSLVLLDEPESHLHPPLLSAFVRALSDLLIDRNGVAIVATHSPVVLQEVPRTCVWMLRRSGDTVIAERPQLETFGEDVGTLTHEVFGLEVTNSGFHKMLTDAIKLHGTYEAVLEAFDGKLGGEARALVRGLIASGQTEGWRF